MEAGCRGAPAWRLCTIVTMVGAYPGAAAPGTRMIGDPMSEVGADEPSQRASAGRSRWLVTAAILLVMALLIAVVLWMGRGGEDGDTAAPDTDEQVEQRSEERRVGRA